MRMAILNVVVTPFLTGVGFVCQLGSWASMMDRFWVRVSLEIGDGDKGREKVVNTVGECSVVKGFYFVCVQLVVGDGKRRIEGIMELSGCLTDCKVAAELAILQEKVTRGRALIWFWWSHENGMVEQLRRMEALYGEARRGTVDAQRHGYIAGLAGGEVVRFDQWLFSSAGKFGNMAVWRRFWKSFEMYVYYLYSERCCDTDGWIKYILGLALRGSDAKVDFDQQDTEGDVEFDIGGLSVVEGWSAANIYIGDGCGDNLC